MQLNEAATQGEGCSNEPCHQLQGLQAQEQIHTQNQFFRYSREPIKLCVVMQADTNALLIRKSIALSS